LQRNHDDQGTSPSSGCGDLPLLSAFHSSCSKRQPQRCAHHALTSTPLTDAVPIALSDVSTPHPNSTVCGAVIPNTAHNEHGRPYGSNTTVSLSELVQVADSRWPEGKKMKAIKWTGRATLEVNMFSDTINTCGNLTGSKIYNAVWQTLNDQCPERIGNNDFPSCWGDSTPLPIRHKTKDTDGSYRCKCIVLEYFPHADCAFQTPTASSVSSAPNLGLRKLVSQCSAHLLPPTKP
jgi:hypothetical protein